VQFVDPIANTFQETDRADTSANLAQSSRVTLGSHYATGATLLWVIRRTTGLESLL